MTLVPDDDNTISYPGSPFSKTKTHEPKQSAYVPTRTVELPVYQPIGRPYENQRTETNEGDLGCADVPKDIHGNPIKNII